MVDHAPSLPPASVAPAPAAPRRGINWRYQIQQYGAALLPTVFLFVVLSVYIFYRRGYYDLYIANKVFAGVAAVLVGIVLLIGPLSRYFSVFDRFVQYRKELGIIAFLLAAIHSLVSFFFLPDIFPSQQFFGRGWWPFIFGLAGVILLAGLFVISNKYALRAIGGKRWWWLQSWGVRLAFALIILHVFVMKWRSWLRWYTDGGGRELARPEWPGAGLLIGWFMALVVLVRLAEFGGPKLGRVAWYVGLIALLAVYVATFWWGSIKFG